MRSADLFHRRPARAPDRPAFRLPAAGLVLELLWAVGLVVLLAGLSVALWAVLSAIGAM